MHAALCVHINEHFMHISSVTLEHKTSHKGPFLWKLRFMHLCKTDYIIFIDAWFVMIGQYLERVQKKSKY